MEGPTDCLVLYIFDTFNSLYVFYDTNVKKYILRGKFRKEDAVPWNFTCKSRQTTEAFIRQVILKSCASQRLYNCPNLPYSSDDITMDTLDNYADESYEVTRAPELSKLSTTLRILRSVNNTYEPPEDW